MSKSNESFSVFYRASRPRDGLTPAANVLVTASTAAEVARVIDEVHERYALGRVAVVAGEGRERRVDRIVEWSEPTRWEPSAAVAWHVGRRGERPLAHELAASAADALAAVRERLRRESSLALLASIDGEPARWSASMCDEGCPFHVA